MRKRRRVNGQFAHGRMMLYASEIKQTHSSILDSPDEATYGARSRLCQRSNGLSSELKTTSMRNTVQIPKEPATRQCPGTQMYDASSDGKARRCACDT